MPYSLTFSERHVYPPVSPGITIPVVLIAGSQKVEILAKIDTDATYCLFDRGSADALSIAVESGERKTFSTINSQFDAFGHEVTLDVLGIPITSVVYFYAEPTFKRNVLGRTGWLDRLRLGLVDYDQMLYLNAYHVE